MEEIKLTTQFDEAMLPKITQNAENVIEHLKRTSGIAVDENGGREKRSITLGKPIATDFTGMFAGAMAFNGDISGWKFTSVGDPTWQIVESKPDPITIYPGKRMLVTETPYKINFIDHNDNFVGFSTDQCCCENHGILIFSKLHRYWENSKLDKTNIGNYTFDVENQEISEEDEATIRSFVEKRIDHDEGDFSRELYIHIVRMKKGDGKRPAYLVMYNEHNGYYSHLVNSNINNVEFEENI